MIRNLILPASVCEIAEYVFDKCRRLWYADLSAARRPKSPGSAAFRYCDNLEQVMLNGSLKTIRSKCFGQCGVEKIAFQRTLRCIEAEVFLSCECLRQVRLTDCALESIGPNVFSFSGLESFTVPPSLREIGVSAFCG